MLIPPPTLVGLEGDDDRRRHRLDQARQADGRLYAINPEAGYFGVAPGTNEKTNPNCMASVAARRDLHQRRAHRRRRRLVGGHDRRAAGAPDRLAGPRLDAGAGRRRPAPRRRIRTPASPSPRPTTRRSTRPGTRPAGVPIDAFIFGGRRSTTVPLVDRGARLDRRRLHGRDDGLGDDRRRRRRAGRRAPRSVRHAAVHRLQHERLLPALARPRRDPRVRSGATLPKIFCVNWFRKGPDGKFVWPGYGENMRVLRWIVERVEGTRRRRAQRLRPDAALRGPRLVRPRLRPRRATTLVSERRRRRLAPASSSCTTSCSASSRTACRASCPRCASASPRVSPLDGAPPRPRCGRMSQPESAPPSRGAVAAVGAGPERRRVRRARRAARRHSRAARAARRGHARRLPLRRHRPARAARRRRLAAVRVRRRRPPLGRGRAVGPEQLRARALILRRHAALNRSLAEFGGFDPLVLEPSTRRRGRRRRGRAPTRRRRRSGAARSIRSAPALLPWVAGFEHAVHLLPGPRRARRRRGGDDAGAPVSASCRPRRRRARHRRAARRASGRSTRSTTAIEELVACVADLYELTAPLRYKVETVRRDAPKVGRNDPCPCGSGKQVQAVPRRRRRGERA